ncbi:TPR repeat-containing protein [Nostoc sp. NIES-4103]|nr:TPR repeat-containing protein [Nostoc sp. NIES-4103]
MKGLKLAVAMIALATLTLTPKAEAKSLFNNQQTPASKVTAQLPDTKIENSSQTEYFLKRGFERFESKDYQGAIEDFNQVLKIEPKNIYAYVGRGGAKLLLGEYQAAKLDLDTALEINPDISIAYYFRAIANYALKDKPGAIADFRKASTLFKQEGKVELAQKADNAVKEIEAS